MNSKYTLIDICKHGEICELSPTGEYIPASVHHTEHQGCMGTFLLQQGIQRRIRITLIYEAGSEIHWLRVNELVIGVCVCEGVCV